MSPDELLNRTNDLNNPDVLAAALREAAATLEQQSNVARGGGAMGGHPNPQFFYGRTAMLMKTAADKLAPAPVTAPVVETPIGGAPPPKVITPSAPVPQPEIPNAWSDGAPAPTPPAKKR